MSNTGCSHTHEREEEQEAVVVRRQEVCEKVCRGGQVGESVCGAC